MGLAGGVAAVKRRLRDKRTWLGMLLQLAMWGSAWCLWEVGRGLYMRKVALIYARQDDGGTGMVDEDLLHAFGHRTVEEEAWDTTIFNCNRFTALFIPDRYN